MDDTEPGSGREVQQVVGGLALMRAFFKITNADDRRAGCLPPHWRVRPVVRRRRRRLLRASQWRKQGLSGDGIGENNPFHIHF